MSDIIRPGDDRLGPITKDMQIYGLGQDVPVERHPTPYLKAMEGKPGVCQVCSRAGGVYLDRTRGPLTRHHRIAKVWWSVPGSAKKYLQWKVYAGLSYYRDSPQNLIVVCHRCHELPTGMAPVFPDLMGDKMRALVQTIRQRVSEAELSSGERANVHRLWPDCILHEAFEMDLQDLRHRKWLQEIEAEVEADHG